jgi:phenylacetate-CoA ligase
VRRLRAVDPLAPLWAGIVQPALARLRGGPEASLHARAAAWRAHHRLPGRALLAAAFGRLRALLVHAWRTVPLQRARMEAAGLDPWRLRAPEELAALPVLTRWEVAERARDLVSREVAPGGLVEVRTGGTTSEPVPFFQDREAVAAKSGLALVLRERLGWRTGARSAYLWGAAQDLPSGARGRIRGLRQTLRDRWGDRALYLPAGDLGDATLDAHAEALRRFRPEALQGYPTATDLLARRLLGRGGRLHVPLVLLTAEPVLPAPRARVAGALGAEVLTFYGSRECGWIASECRERRRLHVNAAGVWLEALEDGRLLVTDLLNRGMPMLRYEIGDLGALDRRPCPCGDPRPVIAALEGRALDVFTLPSGRRVPGVLPDVRGIQQDALGILDARIVQEEDGSVEVAWIAGPNFRPEHLEAFHGEVAIRMRRTERLEPEPNGKVRHCVSRVRPDAALRPAVPDRR